MCIRDRVGEEWRGPDSRGGHGLDPPPATGIIQARVLQVAEAALTMAREARSAREPTDSGGGAMVVGATGVGPGGTGPLAGSAGGGAGQPRGGAQCLRPRFFLRIPYEGLVRSKIALRRLTKLRKVPFGLKLALRSFVRSVPRPWDLTRPRKVLDPPTEALQGFVRSLTRTHPRPY